MPHRFNEPQIFRQATTPTDTSGPEPVAIGDLWLDTGSPQTLRRCTSITPITFVTAEGSVEAPADADYLVGSAQGGLSAEIVVGTTPGGELGGTWGTPTVDTTHSGSAHHAQDTDVVVVTFFVETPVATDDQAFHRMPFAATLLQVDYLCVGGTNWVGQVQEADANGLNGVDTQTSDTTASAGTNAQVTDFSNSGLDAGDYLKLKSTSISGVPTSLVVTIQYRKA